MVDHNEAMRLADLFELEPDPESLYRQAAALLLQQAERIAELQSAHDVAVEIAAQYAAERDQLRAEVERLKPNAERYQWLREHSYVEVICSSTRDPSWTPQHLDAALDAARTTHKETE